MVFLKVLQLQATEVQLSSDEWCMSLFDSTAVTSVFSTVCSDGKVQNLMT